MSGAYVLDVQSVSRKVMTPPPGIWVLEDINFTVSPGEVVLISGKAGSGKNLLMRTITGLERPTRGTILLAGVDLARLSAADLATIRATSIGIVEKDFHFLDWLTVRDTVAFAADLARSQRKKLADEAVDIALALCEITGYAHQHPSELPVSIQKRVALATAIVCQPLIIFIDAVSSGLHEDEASGFLSIIHTYAVKAQCAVVMTSMYNTAETIADSVYYLDQGVVQQRLRSAAPEDGTHTRDMDSGFYVVDEHGTLLTFNRKAEMLLGYREHDVLGQQFDTVMSFQNRDHKVLERASLPELLVQAGTEAAIDTVEYIKSVHDHWRLFSLHVEPRYGAEDRKCGAVTTFKYIGEEQEIDRMKSDFSAIAAHELRTPLTTINGALEMYIAMREATFSAEDKMLLGGMKQNVVRLSKLVENLIRISRLEQGNLALKTTDLVWPTLIAASIAEYGAAAKQQNVSLILDRASGELPPVAGDEAALREVVDNLIRNALEHTPNGGTVTVRYSYDPKRGRISTSVENNGKGLTAEELQHLFTKFYRASKERAFTDMHLGLGLYITKVLVDLHRGEITAESDEGKGARFTFWLPVQQTVAGV